MAEPKIQYKAVTAEQVEEVEAFLTPFAKAGQLMHRDRSQIIELLDHGFVALNETRIVGFAESTLSGNKALFWHPTPKTQPPHRAL